MKLYVAGPLGFAESSRLWYEQKLLPRLRACGAELLDPWSMHAAEYHDALAIPERDKRVLRLGELNDAAGRDNAAMIETCDAIFAILDGSDVDSGTSAEIGFGAALGKPTIGLRTDFRLASDNEASVVNLQVEHFIRRNGGDIARSLEDAVTMLANLAIGP